MFSKKPVNTQDKVLQAFFESNQQFGSKLEMLVNLAKQQRLSLDHKDVAPNHNVLIQLKWLIFLHALIIDNKNPQIQFKIQKQLKQFPITTTESSLDQILVSKMLEPYRLYLQRRNTLAGHDFGTQNECYLLINLMRRALSFTDILFTLGRYLFKQHHFLVYFNIIMGKDLNKLYKNLGQSLNRQVAYDNVSVIQKINEGLYNIYYNCYFSKYVCNSAPVWIDTQNLHDKSKQQKLTKRTQKHENMMLQSIQTQRTICMDEDAVKSNSTIGSKSDSLSPTNCETTCGNQSRLKDKICSVKEFIEMAQSILEQFQDQQSSSSLQLNQQASSSLQLIH